MMRAMEAAKVKGSMAALVGTSYAAATRWVAAARERTGGVCAVANVNSATQVVISGDDATVAAAIEIGKGGVNGEKVCRLIASFLFTDHRHGPPDIWCLPHMCVLTIVATCDYVRCECTISLSTNGTCSNRAGDSCIAYAILQRQCTHH